MRQQSCGCLAVDNVVCWLQECECPDKLALVARVARLRAAELEHDKAAAAAQPAAAAVAFPETLSRL